MIRLLILWLGASLFALAACGPAAPAPTPTVPPPTPTHDPNADWHTFNSDKIGIAFDYWCSLKEAPDKIAFAEDTADMITAVNPGLGLDNFVTQEMKSMSFPTLRRDDERFRTHDPRGTVLEMIDKDDRPGIQAYFVRGGVVYIFRAHPVANPLCNGYPAGVTYAEMFYRTLTSFRAWKP